jgi:NAD(P)-dependent dehydrogenase (short-subunit alcohol dehydrogenase family)
MDLGGANVKRHSTAIITGAASGIGRATTERFLASGWNVVAADFNAPAGEALVAAWADRHRGEPAQVEFVKVDVSCEAEVEAAVRRALEVFGRLDCVVNNAGIGGAFGPVTDIAVEDWDYTFAVLVRGVFLGTKHGARAFKAQGGGGAIVNTASIAGLVGGVGPQAYSAAKAAVINFGQVAAVELAQHRIRVNTVSPGIIRTPLAESGNRDIASAMAGVQPWPEIGRPEHVAAVIEFLAGDQASFITGENVTVDGGLMAGGPRLGDMIGGNPAHRGLVGVNRGSTGLGHTARRVR